MATTRVTLKRGNKSVDIMPSNVTVNNLKKIFKVRVARCYIALTENMKELGLVYS